MENFSMNRFMNDKINAERKNRWKRKKKNIYYKKIKCT